MSEQTLPALSNYRVTGAPCPSVVPSASRGIAGGWIDTRGRSLLLPRRGGGWSVIPLIPLPSARLDPWVSLALPGLPLLGPTVRLPDAPTEADATAALDAAARASVDEQLRLSRAPELHAYAAFEAAKAIAELPAAWGLVGDYADSAAAAAVNLAMPSTPAGWNCLSRLCLATGLARLALGGGVVRGPKVLRNPVARAIRTASRWVEFGAVVLDGVCKGIPPS